MTTQKLLADNNFLIHNVAVEGRTVLSKYAGIKTLLLFQKQGYFIKKDKCYQRSRIEEELNFLLKYRYLLKELCNILDKNGFIKITKDQIETTEKVEDSVTILEDINTEIYYGKFNKPEYKGFIILPYIKLMDATIPSLFEVAQGTLGYLTLLFPNGDKTIVESIYKTNIQELYNTLVTNYVHQLIAKLKVKHKRISILEIGAGTGGTTSSVLKMIQETLSEVHYCYTDISAGMVRIGRRKFMHDYDFVTYKTLNIDTSHDFQNFEGESFDIVICSNVIHATWSIENSLQNIRKLMKSKDSYLVLNEVIEKLDFNTVTFGLTDGWWKYTDFEYRTAYSPMLDIPVWKSLLEKSNLKEEAITEHSEKIASQTSQNIFIYRK